MRDKIITKAGEYRTWDGDKAVVVGQMPDGDWFGYVHALSIDHCTPEAWDSLGGSYYGENDIIGEWQV